ncbi:hypothetical protein ASF19_20095 [Acidovorax sp. Leaf84]|uniref:portal protein n=1 Tax=Acidovorax sp. Leaf84 TaxID=1736240 RepID=UPI0006F2DB8C|nr:hypothetical protein [Acidovorax sp. Leaf84]KQO38078.1 hypothetical protein ASF19_20095 [Acidovorax sp. Leaf84]
MLNTYPPRATDELQDGRDEPITQEEYAGIVREALSQPPWRAQADHEADYADGNQLSTELLRKMASMGIPPAKENIIGPAIRAVCGSEAKMRTDWRVTPDGEPGGQDVADATNFKLNQAERHSKADRALSAAFKPAAAVGIGWVEVSRASNSLEFPYKCRSIHRNEIWWDMKSVEPDMSDARWLYRRRWIGRTRAARMFPSHATIILAGGPDRWMSEFAVQEFEGGQSTGLKSALDAERAWTVQEDAYYNEENRTVCITELWYRRWVTTVMLKMSDGRVVTYDEANDLHRAALALGRGRLVEELLPVIRRAFWMGPHRLFDGPSQYPHRFFPYVRIMAWGEDLTGIPYGLVRDMLFPQDNLNSTISKLRWGMSAVETIRTKGILAMTDAQFRQMASRVDADFVLDPEKAAEPGARFERNRDFQLNTQQFQLMNDSRAAAARVSGITAAFQGQEGTATSGVQEQTQVEQSQVSLADLMDAFKDAREMVGELLLSMVIEDLGKEESTVVIEGDVINPPRTVVLNRPEVDPETGIVLLSNDVQRTRLKVAMGDVPSSSSFRTQQLNALSESVKAAPPEIQQVVMPFMIDLMDLPRKKEVVQAIREASAGKIDQNALREQIKQELMYDLKLREVEVKERESDARIQHIVAQAVQTGVQAAFSAMQAGAQVAQMPMIAPIADEVMKGAGYKPAPGGVDPNFPVPPEGQTAAMNIKSPYIQGGGVAVVPEADAQTEANAAPAVRANTSPAFPPVPKEAGTGLQGIETPSTVDNLQ